LSRADIVRRYIGAHWGNEPGEIIRWQDPQVPDCTQMGRLMELHVVTLDGEAGVLDFPAGCHLAWDPGHSVDRLHLLCVGAHVGAVRAQVERAVAAGWALQTLGSLAKQAGGRHAEHPYPHLRALDLGEVTHVVYATDKAGDGPSEYIHAFGEESGIRPRLAADVEGRLWLVGGNYTVPDEGITD
jgi:hypothetical protein